MSIADDRDRLIHILVVHYDMFRDKAEEAADLFLHDKTLSTEPLAQEGGEVVAWQVGQSVTIEGSGTVGRVTDVRDGAVKVFYFNKAMQRDEEYWFPVAVVVLASPPITSTREVTITDEMVERAARALHANSKGKHNHFNPFEDLSAQRILWLREDARAALLASLTPKSGE